jgi:hypothetical protein
MPVQVAVGGIAIRAEPFRPTATTGVPAIQPGATPIARRQGPTRFRGEGSTDAVGALLPMPRYRAISDAAPGTTCGNHRANLPRHLGASPGMVFAVQMHEPTRKAGRNPHRIPPYKRGVTGSNPVAPTRKDQVRPHVDLDQTYPRIHSGNHRCMLRVRRPAARARPGSAESRSSAGLTREYYAAGPPTPWKRSSAC